MGFCALNWNANARWDDNYVGCAIRYDSTELVVPTSEQDPNAALEFI
jgi:hypothetical protein